MARLTRQHRIWLENYRRQFEEAKRVMNEPSAQAIRQAERQAMETFARGVQLDNLYDSTSGTQFDWTTATTTTTPTGTLTTYPTPIVVSPEALQDVSFFPPPATRPEGGEIEHMEQSQALREGLFELGCTHKTRPDVRLQDCKSCASIYRRRLEKFHDADNNE